MSSLRPSSLAVGAFVCLTLTAGLATAESVKLELRFQGPDKMDFTFEGQITGEEAQQTRFYIDYLGNKDNTVQSSEVDAYEQQALQAPEGNASSDDSFTMDGKKPSSEKMTSLDLQGAEGSTNSTAPIDSKTMITYTFPVTAGDRHTFVSKDTSEDEEDAELDGTITLYAPTDYIISETRGLPSSYKVSSDKKSLTGTESAGSSSSDEVTIIFEKEGGGSGIPALGFLALAAVVGLVAVGVRMRRRE